MKELHPLCEIFPIMSTVEFGQLEESIKRIGLVEPITLHKDGRILDGRCREIICEKVGQNPRYDIFKGDDEAAVRYVVARNIARRHLNSGQLSMAAIEAEKWYKDEANKRKAEGQKKGGQKKGSVINKGLTLPTKNCRNQNLPELVSDNLLARDFKTNREYINKARKIRSEAPDLAYQVKAGEINIPKAAKILDERKKEKEKNVGPKETDWPAEVRRFKRDATKTLKEGRSIEKNCAELSARFNEFKAHLGGEEVRNIYNHCVMDLHEVFGRISAQFEPTTIL